MSGFTEIVGPPGVGKTTLARNLSDVRVPPCDCDLSALLAAIDQKLVECAGSGLVAKRLEGLRAVVGNTPGIDRVICDGPIGWVGAVAARTDDRSVTDPILAAMPKARVIHLTATPEAIRDRLSSRPDGAQRHVDKAAHYDAVAFYVVEGSGADATVIDTTDMAAEAVAEQARERLR